MSDIGLTLEVFVGNGMVILVVPLTPTSGRIAGRTCETCVGSERILVIPLRAFVVLTSVARVPQACTHNL